MGISPEYAAGAHASRRRPGRSSTYGVPERRVVNTGVGTTVCCKCALNSLQDMPISTPSDPSTGNGGTSSIGPIHSAGSGATAHPWDRHSPTADGSKTSAAMPPGLQGRCIPLQPMWTSHLPGPTAKVTSFRQRSNLLQPVVFRTDVERVLAVPKLQQSDPIPVRAASLNYREVDLPVVHLAELDSMDCEVVCHAAHSIDSSLLSDRGFTVTRRASSARFVHKTECTTKAECTEHRRDTRAFARRTACREK